ncbi:UNVERIFIED_CONTAM: Alpha-1,3-mannosyl-glycoprotein 2-beta-N-acetylglucosaminyltransferase [Sesamum radiatum]|uniref:Alpha-1,3-mannosyl-glycoprotein 2-beta-N-acetylglucosaminyltransferase n=1 Tax=Sesamum radiatum TaxID=300843 RepID=A0AAW2RUL1_SESRA
MRKCYCDYRYLLLIAAVPFIYIQMRLFATQSQYADRLADAIEAENQCTKQTRFLIDQISTQKGQILSLEGALPFLIQPLMRVVTISFCL